MSFKPAIKWSGSKRSQAEEIIKKFPKKIETYYEPFVGGGSVMYQLLLQKEISFDKIVCSDVNNDLISLWNMIKNEVEVVVDNYRLMWSELNFDEDSKRKNEYYYQVRDRFNEFRNPIDFLFLNRMATNGLIRYNSKNEFNTSFHFSRKGIEPDTLEKILKEWSLRLNQFNVEFHCSDYKSIQMNPMDVMYLDPPYAATKGMYNGALNYDEFWDWLCEQQGMYLLSFDGKSGDVDRTFAVPENLYDEHIYISSGVSSFKRIKNKEISHVEESLYIKKATH